MTESDDSFESALGRTLLNWRVEISERATRLLRAHFEAVVAANRVMNLTRITDPVSAAVRHYGDSLALLPWVRDQGADVSTVLDIGTGAGFPSVALAVVCPEWRVTAIDSTGKKARFVAETGRSLGLSNLEVHQARAGAWETGGSYTIVVCRALTAAGRCLEQASHHVAPGGRLVLYKTAVLASEEERDAARIASRLGFRFDGSYAYHLTDGDSSLSRALWVYAKP